MLRVLVLAPGVLEPVELCEAGIPIARVGLRRSTFGDEAYQSVS